MRQYSKKIFVKSLILMLVMFVLIYIAVSVLGMDRSPYLTLSENHIIGEITYTDGTTRKNLVPDQWRMSRGDVLRARIKLPSVKPYNNTSISFTVYNAEIDLGYDGETFYSYGHDLAAKNREIGNILVVAEVPDYAWGNWINLTLREQERSPSLQNSAYRLIPTVRARVLPIIGHGMEFVVFSVLMVLGTAIGLAGVIFVTGKKNRILTMSIGFATFLLCCWYFGYNRFFYAISTNIRINAMAEYYAIHLVGLPITGFVYTVMEEGIRKKVVFWVGVFLAVLSLGAISMSLTGVIMLSDSLPGLQATLAVLLVVLLWLLISGARKDKNGFEASLLMGITVGMIFAVTEIVSLRIRTIKGFPRALMKVTSLDYAAVGLAILILTLIIGIVDKLYHDMRAQAEQDELEKIAYTDQLTGIPNRISCVEKMRMLTVNDYYAVAFFDVDGLKKANDNYGHDVGDELIKEVADLIRNTFFTYKGYYGRWGGDEFIAVFLDEPSYRRFGYVFEDAVDEEAKKSKLQVPFSVSVGYKEHMPGMSETVNEIVNEADEQMYRSKKAKKAARSD